MCSLFLNLYFLILFDFLMYGIDLTSFRVSGWILFLEEMCIFINTCWNFSRGFWIFLLYSIHNKGDETSFIPLWGINQTEVSKWYVLINVFILFSPRTVLAIDIWLYLLALKHTLCLWEQKCSKVRRRCITLM